LSIKEDIRVLCAEHDRFMAEQASEPQRAALVQLRVPAARPENAKTPPSARMPPAIFS
jgi:hypothetical protein